MRNKNVNAFDGVCYPIHDKFQKLYESQKSQQYITLTVQSHSIPTFLLLSFVNLSEVFLPEL